MTFSVLWCGMAGMQFCKARLQCWHWGKDEWYPLAKWMVGLWSEALVVKFDSSQEVWQIQCCHFSVTLIRVECLPSGLNDCSVVKLNACEHLYIYVHVRMHVRISRGTQVSLHSLHRKSCSIVPRSPHCCHPWCSTTLFSPTLVLPRGRVPERKRWVWLMW